MKIKDNVLSNLSEHKIILCSNSPRRKELLNGLNIDFQIRVIDGVDESYDEGLNGEDIAQMIATKKADAYKASMAADEITITADTIVYVDGDVLGKPTDRKDAIRMVNLISGRTHDVITGVCVQTLDRRVVFSVSTKVSFVPLSDAEIEFYVDKYKPFDKAGAYGIQEWIGYVGVDYIEGSFFNVMGLPIQKLYSVLKTF